jgi:hypothetical protein
MHLNNYINENKYVIINFRLRIGILLICIGLIWFAKNAGLFASEFFGPLIMLVTGIWLIITYCANRMIKKYNCWISCLDFMQCD